MRIRARAPRAAAAAVLLTMGCVAPQSAPAPRPAAESQAMPFQDPSLPVADRAADLLGRLTLEEKAGLLVSQSPGVPRLGVPAYDWWSESLHGVARAGRATVFPQAIGLAATWDTDLMGRVGEAISYEARAKYEESVRLGSRTTNEGLTFFAPNINIFRDPRWGRGMETYGEDPYLTGALAVRYIRGMQGDDPAHPRTVATAKHYAVHSGPEPIRHEFDARPSERDLQDTYLPAFRATVEDGGVASVMCAYNRVFGDPACASTRLLADILRKQWGFTGTVVSDCWAVSDFVGFHHVAADETEAAAQALEAGTDIVCGPEYRSLPEAVERGLVTEAQVDTAVTRVLDTRFRLGLFDPPDTGPWARIGMDVVDSPEHQALAREAARKSLVLLKNDGDLLPLRDVRTLAVIGPDADDLDLLLGNYNGWPSHAVTPLEGMRAAAAERGIDVRYARGSAVAAGVPTLRSVPVQALRGLTAHYFSTHDFTGAPFAERPEATLDHQWWREAPLPGMPADSFSVRWTGTLVPPVSGRYALGARVNGSVRVLVDDSVVVDFSDRFVVATPSGWVDLVAGEPRRLTVEYSDRRIDAQVELLWAPPEPDLQAEAVQTARASDVAVLFLGLSPRLEGEEMPVEVPGFAGGDRVTLGLPEPQEALLQAVVATGTPTVVVLLNGSALAISWAAEHVPAILEAWYPGQEAGGALADVLLRGMSPGGRLPVTVYRSVDQLPAFDDYRMEGRTYRWFRGEPLFPFGHGLSYTRFRYGELQAPTQVTVGEDVALSVEMENAGAVAGDEVVQVYATPVGAGADAPVRTLVAFTRVRLEPGERRQVTFTLPADALTTVDEAGRRLQRPGAWEISVGGKQPGQHGLGDAATTEVSTARVNLVH